jgi:hypothetical protein
MSTVTTMMARARRRLNEQDSTTFHSDDDFIAYADEAQKYVAEQSQCLEEKLETVTVANQADYAVPSDFLIMKRLLVNGTRARPISFEQIDDEGLEESEINITGEAYYYIFADEYTIIPTPEASGTALKLFYIKEPTEITALVNTLVIPSYLEDSVVSYMVYAAWLKDIEYDLAEFNLSECNAKIALNKRIINSKDNDSQKAIKMGLSMKRRRPLEGT